MFALFRYDGCRTHVDLSVLGTGILNCSTVNSDGGDCPCILDLDHKIRSRKREPGCDLSKECVGNVGTRFGKNCVKRIVVPDVAA